MISVYLECPPEEREMLLADLNDRGTLGVIELTSGFRAWFDTSAGLEDLIERYDGEIQNEPKVDWVRQTEESFPALEVGQRFWLAPPWNTEPPPAGRVRLEINPGLACGTGWHPCTQLCIEALERHVTPGASVLDVGTGSGILTVAARLLGANRTVSCDTDAEAVTIARERIGDAVVFTGSAESVQSSTVDLVVANISAPIIDAILPDLLRVCRAGGVIILSGFQNPPDLESLPIESSERDGWQCLVARAPVPRPADLA